MHRPAARMIALGLQLLGDPDAEGHAVRICDDVDPLRLARLEERSRAMDDEVGLTTTEDGQW